MNKCSQKGLYHQNTTAEFSKEHLLRIRIQKFIQTFFISTYVRNLQERFQETLETFL